MSAEITVRNGAACFAQNSAFPLPWWNGMSQEDIKLQAALLDNPDRYSMAQASGTHGDMVRNACVVMLPGGSFARIPDKYTITYNVDGTIEPISIVGGDFSLWSPSDVWDMGEHVLNACKGSELVNAMRLRDGRIMGLTIALAKSVKVKGDKSEIRRFLNITTGFDGLWKSTINDSHVRSLCMNTVRAAMRNNKVGFVIKHTKSHAGKVQDAMAAIANAEAYSAEWGEEMNRLAGEKLTDTLVNAVLAELYPGDSTRAGNVRDTIASLYHGRAAGWAEMAHGTSYTLINAVGEYAEHHAGTRVEGDRNPLSLLLERSLVGGKVDQMVHKAQAAIAKVLA